MTEYFLKKHIYLCKTENRCVLLDLKKDKYICLDQGGSDTLTLLLSRDQTKGGVGKPRPRRTAHAVDNIADTMLGKELLTTDKLSGKPDGLTQLSAATERLLDERDRPQSPIRTGQVLNFLAASTVAWWKWRRWPIDRTVRSIEQRKSRHLSPWTGADFAKARELVSVFNALRPLFPANYLCLFDSLALLEFLARYQLFPTWTYGVEVEPFNAHCWVQEGTVLFNDRTEVTQLYTPIMAV